MSFFRRTRTLEERFPPERLSWLPSLIMSGGIIHASHVGLDGTALTSSKFFGGYIMGYPAHLDGVNKNLGAGIRIMIFKVIYGDHRCDHMYQRVVGHMMLDDQQVHCGISFGEPDGQRFCKALEDKLVAEDATLSLKSAFEIGSVDLAQSI